ncbi:hypothetical protein J2S13_001061 [Oikeobacillus pervagus]|uniref:Sporulation inhibitor of replication protein SirA n=1 Tax=Oikeobacillus pervagus TaxID=1325931 RepID=A0AAJ1SY70_9BACI|nr:sporulation inhibitor of replication protein SirA [Oikeobacillus pervagus]MDQ0214664.1 hypothetical protein [Oikeobacillus pervagus]
MRSYQIYWVVDEFANYFYGRERVFFNLFSEWKKTDGIEKTILEKQVQFITRPIPYLHIHRLLHHFFQKRKGFMNEGRVYQIHFPKKSNYSILRVEDRKLLISAKGSYDAESIFFEPLEHFHGRLLAIDFENERYGWLKPIKERKYV